MWILICFKPAKEKLSNRKLQREKINPKMIETGNNIPVYIINKVG